MCGWKRCHVGSMHRLRTARYGDQSGSMSAHEVSIRICAESFPESQQKKFELEYPKKQVFTKTDLAKYSNVWEVALTS